MPHKLGGWRTTRSSPEEWTSIRAALKDREEPRAFLDKWLEERGRAFAIETGQIEGLYTLKAGITEQLVAEGLAGVVGAHTVENIEDATVKGLLADHLRHRPRPPATRAAEGARHRRRRRAGEGHRRPRRDA